MIVALLRKQTVASLSEVMAALGTGARRTAFRKLKGLATRTSYSHRGGYYTLDERVEFDPTRTVVVRRGPVSPASAP